MAWTLTPALIRLRAEVNVAWPDRDKAADGSIGDVAHQKAGTSDHLPDRTGVVRAIDIDDNDARDSDEGIGRAIAEHLRRIKDPRVKYLIYHGQLCSSYSTRTHSAWSWRPYFGVNAHAKHLHISVVADARGLGGGDWGLTASAFVITPPTLAPVILEDEMPDREVARQDGDPNVYLGDQIHRRWLATEGELARVADRYRARTGKTLPGVLGYTSAGVPIVQVVDDIDWLGEDITRGRHEA